MDMHSRNPVIVSIVNAYGFPAKWSLCLITSPHPGMISMLLSESIVPGILRCSQYGKTPPLYATIGNDGRKIASVDEQQIL